MSAALTKTDLLALLANGENSAVEFKRDAIKPQDLAKELVAFANFEGGRVLLGVEDDGTVSGLNREPGQVEEWVMTACRTHIQPGIIPFYQLIRDVEPGRDIAVIEVAQGWTVLHRWHNQTATYYIRIGTVSAEMHRDELSRLFQQRGQLRGELRPVAGTTLADLHLGRLTDYFQRVRQQATPALDDVAGWQQLLLNTEMMVEEANPVCAVAGLLLFGKNPNRFLPQAGITAAVFSGIEKDYVTPQSIRGPLVGLFRDSEANLLEPGVIDSALAFVQTHATDQAELNGALRNIHWHYPKEAIRECLVNAVAHRDYMLAATDIELSIYADRLEVVSPGRLPNGITPARMRTGCRASRNQLIKDTLRDYHYMEHMGLGVPRKIIRLMLEHNGSEPELIVDGEQFTVRLWR